MEKSRKVYAKDELTLCVNKVIRHKSPMPEDLKKKKKSNAESLEKMLEKFLEQKGEADAVEIRRNGSSELVIDGLSSQTLHSFLVKVQEIGKNLTYTKTLKVEITD